MSDTIRPPIPATCESRPTAGGLVIPWANVQLADGGVDFRAQHESRVQRCMTESRCQVCSKTIPAPIVFLGGPRQVGSLTFDEPPLHPECAVYVSHACPMVAGRLDHYADRDTVTEGRRGELCSVPGCECGGWVPTPGLQFAPGGDPAHDWYAVYVSGYSCGITPDRPDRVHAAVVHQDEVLAIRHVSAPGTGRTWRRTTIEQAVR
ncbi:hypothetical protein [Mycobacterium sp. PSTR-4-N]|uniref:hypothetical protein n=1 Tax=Mycobacterium sp. PSTR-4-N TaxID=2917745 RepID=UPI001F154E35|nr:hypothetical protein [Mycobacterium sp. PSTR-4-N]MCG7592422.1 hypothetical protein [Mycobacterium sp. PSTR-4-N]